MALNKTHFPGGGHIVDLSVVSKNETAMDSNSDEHFATIQSIRQYILDNAITTIHSAAATPSISMATDESYYHFTLTENTTLNITECKQGAIAYIFIDGDHSLNLPSTIKQVWQGGYDGSNGRVNLIIIKCKSSTTGSEQMEADLYIMPASTSVHSVWELNEKGGDFVCGVGNAKTADVVSEVFPAGITWQPRTGGGLGGRYTLEGDGVVGSTVETPMQVNAPDSIFMMLLLRVPDLVTSGNTCVLTTGSGPSDDGIQLTKRADSSFGFVHIVNNTVYQAISGFVNTANEWRLAMMNIDSSGNISGWLANVDQATLGSKYTATSPPIDTSLLYDMRFFGGQVPTSSLFDGEIAYFAMVGTTLSDDEVASVFNGGNIQSLQSVLDSSRGAGTYDSLDFAYAWDLNEGPQNKVIGVDNAGNEIGSEKFDDGVTYITHTGNPTLSNYRLNSNYTPDSFVDVIRDLPITDNRVVFNCWVVPKSTVGGQSWIAIQEVPGSTGDLFNVGQGSTNSFGANHRKNGVLTSRSTPSFFTPNNLYHVVCQITPSGDMELWSNNAQVFGTFSGTPVPLDTSLKWTVTLFSRDGFPGTNGWNGQIIFAEMATGINLDGAQVASLYNGGSGSTIESVLGTPTYQALPFACVFNPSQPPLTSSKTFDHVASLDSAILPAGVSRLPSTDITGTPAICGPVIYDFDGSANCSVALNSETFGGTSGYYAWFYVDNLGSSPKNSFIYYGEPTSGDLGKVRMSVRYDGSPTFQIRDSVGFKSLFGTAGTVVAGAWNLLYCHITPLFKMEIYLNGAKDPIDLQISETIPTVSRTHYIGSRSAGNETSDYLDGKIGYHGIVEGNLTPKQIEHLWNSGRGNSIMNVTMSGLRE